MSRQTTALRKERREVAQAEEFIEEAAAKVRRRREPEDYDFTAEDIIRERDHRSQSWRQVAVTLGLGSPSAARKAYTALTGVNHHDSQPLVKRQAKGTFSGRKVDRPVWDDDTDQDEITERLHGEWHPARGSGKDYVPGHYDGALVTIERSTFGFSVKEDISVSRVEKFRYTPEDKLEIHVFERDSNASRVFMVTDVRKVQ